MSAGKVDVDGLIASAQRALRNEGYGDGLVEDLAAARAAVAALLQADRAFDMARARKQEVDNRFVRLNAEKKPATEQDYWDRKSADHSYARAADERINVLRRLGATHLEPVPTQAVRS